MDLFTNTSFITLTGHIELEKYRYVYFIVCLFVYLLIVCCNILVLFVIYTDKHLYEQMYVFIAALLLNSLIGATIFYPKLLSDFLSETQVISRDACIFQSFFIYTYAGSEFTLLSAMAYDRYVSICKPLQYSALVKISTCKKLLFFCWIVPSCETGVGLILTYQLKLCRFKINRIYCNNNVIVKLSCDNTSIKTSYGMFAFSVAVFPPVVFIIISYIQILNICLKNSKDFRRKALQTCFPHLFTFTCFTVTSCFEIINSWLEARLPPVFSLLMSIINLIIPPVINPVIYGLKMQEIRKRIKRIFWKTKILF
ncbi:olfactory receptor 2F1-like [Hoplias malabaricus]|uniref:olfactory receptor 2F1-like n=1 Tax=Hoplias malabaricus TaxID=27720 RepID=UPI003461BBB5